MSTSLTMTLIYANQYVIHPVLARVTRIQEGRPSAIDRSIKVLISTLGAEGTWSNEASGDIYMTHT